VKALLKEGMATRQGRRDIPFTIFKNFLFPAAQHLHTIFLFKAKNSDLGYVPAPAAQAPDAAPLEARLLVFLQFLQVENGVPTKTVREVIVPAELQADGATYDPSAEEWYSTGYPFRLGIISWPWPSFPTQKNRRRLL
jgi:hypothetical protein